MTWFFWALLTALFWGLGPIFAKLGLVKSDPFTALLLRSLGVFAALVIWGLATARFSALKEVEPRTWSLLIAEGMAASVFGHFAYYNALKLGKISSVVPITTSYPLLAMLLAVLLLGDRLTLGRGLGGALIVLGVFLIQRF